MSNNPSISIIVPVLNEEGSLEIFYTETSKVLREYSDWEMIFVDDGSDDESFNIIRGIAEKDSRVTVIQFFKNVEVRGDCPIIEMSKNKFKYEVKPIIVFFFLCNVI